MLHVLSLPVDVDLVSTKLSVNCLYHSGKFCDRFLDAGFASGSNIWVFAAESDAEPERCWYHLIDQEQRQARSCRTCNFFILPCLKRFGD